MQALGGIDMFNHLKYRFKLQKIFNNKKKIQNAFSKEIGKAYQQKKSSDEIHLIKQNEYFEVGMIQEEIDILITNHLREKATALFVPLPEYNQEKMWTKCDKISQQKILTRLGINTIKTAIRKERKERIELLLMVAASLTGVIGAITGLIALLKK